MTDACILWSLDFYEKGYAKVICIQKICWQFASWKQAIKKSKLLNVDKLKNFLQKKISVKYRTQTQNQKSTNWKTCFAVSSSNFVLFIIVWVECYDLQLWSHSFWPRCTIFVLYLDMFLLKAVILMLAS